jgi:hypothetical protein
MIAALEISTEFWRLSREESAEAAKAYGIFSFVLSTMKKRYQLAGAGIGIMPDKLGATVGYDAPPFDNPLVMEDAFEWPNEFEWVSARGQDGRKLL